MRRTLRDAEREAHTALAHPAQSAVSCTLAHWWYSAPLHPLPRSWRGGMSEKRQPTDEVGFRGEEASEGWVGRASGAEREYGLVGVLLDGNEDV